MNAGHPEESWEAWTRRVAADLDALEEGRWSTFTLHVDADADDSAAPRPEPSGRTRWRRRATRTAASTPPVPPEVFLQASRVEGVLALECIVDPEFEGLSALDPDHAQALERLGWEATGGAADLSRVLPPDATAAAADLLARTLRHVLGADAPSAVDRRHG